MTANNQNDDVPRLLVQCRTDRQLTQEEVAKAIKITTAALSRIERGINKPRRTTRLRISEFLRKHGYFPRQEAA